jgi:hypothetical protein
VDQPLQEALLVPKPLADGVAQYRLVVEDPQGSQSRPDQPLAPFSVRRFGMRRVRSLSVEAPAADDTNDSLPEPFTVSVADQTP